MHILYARNNIGIVKCIPFEQNLLQHAKDLAIKVAKSMDQNWSEDKIRYLSGSTIILDPETESACDPEVIIFTDLEVNMDTFSSYFFRF